MAGRPSQLGHDSPDRWILCLDRASRIVDGSETNATCSRGLADMTQVQGERNRQDEGAQMERRYVFVVNSSPEFLDLLRDLLQDEH